MDVYKVPKIDTLSQNRKCSNLPRLNNSQPHSHNTLLFFPGGAAHLGGVLLTTLENKPDGTFDLDEFEKRIRGSDIHEPVTAMVAVENTHNYCGGKVSFNTNFASKQTH